MVSCPQGLGTCSGRIGPAGRVALIAATDAGCASRSRCAHRLRLAHPASVAAMSATRPAGPIRPEHVPKPWGHETIWARTDRYVGKILHVRAGEGLSLQYHRRKEETMRVLSGAVTLEVGAERGEPRRVRLGPGEGFHLPPGTRHRVTALEDADILEVSTPELDDVVRLADRCGRVP